MTDPISIGRTADADLLLNTDKLVGAHTCVIANAGAGKSGLLRVIAERTYGRAQQIILDAEDEYYTLREAHPDYLLAGGENGDCPAVPDNAEQLAAFVLKHRISAIVQLNSLSTFDQDRFVSRFLTAMMEAPKELWHPVLLFLDEAHRFAPQDGDAMSLKAVRDLTARGRKRGYTALLGTQRLAKIDKNVTADVNNWFMGRVGQSTDRRVAADALGFSATSAEGRGLQSLESRSFWAFGVATTHVPTLFKVAQAQTTIPQAGQQPVSTPPPVSTLGALLAELAPPPAPDADVPQGDDAPARQLTAAERQAAYNAGAEQGHMDGFMDGRHVGEAEGLKRALDLIQGALDESLHELSESGRAMVLGDPPPSDGEEYAAPEPLGEPQPVVPVRFDLEELQGGREKLAAAAAAIAPLESGDGPSPASAAFIAALARVHPVHLTWVQLTAMAGRKGTGGSAMAAKRQMLARGWMVAGADDRLSLTPAGAALVDAKHEVVDPVAAFQQAFDAMPGSTGRIFRHIVEHPGDRPPEIAAALGLKTSGGSWHASLRFVRRSEIVQEVDGGLSLIDVLRNAR